MTTTPNPTPALGLEPDLDTDLDLDLGPDLDLDLGAKLARQAIRARSSRGMTLIEILVVLAIIGLIMGGVAVYAFGALEGSKESTAANDIAALSQSIEMYQLQKNKCPKSVQDLKAAGIIKRVTKDPWNSDYEIKCPGEHGAADISSPGKDRQMGTDDDINSWDEDLGEAEEGDK